MQRIFFLFFFVFIATISSAQKVDENLLVASLERTTCYGDCPYYEVKIYANGVATYHGKKNVAFIGKHRAKVSQKMIQQILNKAESVGYETFNNKYPKKGLGIIDFPMCITSLKTTNGKKIIYNRNDSPQKLVEYQEFFDELIEDIEWQKVAL